MAETQSKEGISLADKVAANSTQTVEFTAPAPGTVEGVSIRIYPGAELDLRLYPEIVRHSGGTAQPLVTTLGKDHIDGDDDKWAWEINKPVEDGDVIRIRAENTNANYAYDYRANLDVDYQNGIRRAIREIYR